MNLIFGPLQVRKKEFPTDSRDAWIDNVIIKTVEIPNKSDRFEPKFKAYNTGHWWKMDLTEKTNKVIMGS